jgi:hypothetical protein
MIEYVEAANMACSSAENWRTKPLQARSLPVLVNAIVALGQASTFQVLDTEATMRDRPADRGPADVAIATISLSFPFPKEAALDFLQELEHLFGRRKDHQLVQRDGAEDRFLKRQPSCLIHELGLPSGQHASGLVDDRL